MILVGLTGGIGSGKTTVSAMLAARGAVIIDADQITRELQAPGSPVLAEIVDAFGEDVLDPSGAPVPKKSHTLSPVPFVAIDHSGRTLSPATVESPGISNIAATLLLLLGHAVPPGYRPPLLHLG